MSMNSLCNRAPHSFSRIEISHSSASLLGVSGSWTSRPAALSRDRMNGPYPRQTREAPGPPVSEAHAPAATGGDGRNGRAGGKGADGATFDHPPVYLVFGSVEGVSPSQSFDKIELEIDFDGVTGATGGEGGPGGNGGNGAQGRNGRERMGVCSRGPGKGGDGGNGGRGGPGGAAGDGGNAPTVFIATDREGLDLLALSDFNLSGASAGAPGKGGAGGRGGRAGGSGDAPGLCSPRSPGSVGRSGSPGPTGGEGAAGQDGKIFGFLLRSASDFNALVN